MKRILIGFIVVILGLLSYTYSLDIDSLFLSDIQISILSGEKNDYDYNLKLRESQYVPVMFEEIKEQYKKVGVEILYNQNKYLAKLTPAGRNAQHFIPGELGSFSLEFSSSLPFFYKKLKFYPVSAKGVNHIISLLIGSQFNNPIQNQKLANISFDGQNYGLYYIIGDFTKDFLINNDLSENIEIYEEVNAFVPSGSVGSGYKDNVLYWKKNVKMDSSFDFLNNVFNVLKFKQYSNLAYLFDVDNLLKINATHVLLGSHHQDYSHNNLLYYDRTKGLLGFYLWDNILSESMGNDKMLDEYYNYLIQHLLEKPEYFYKRNMLLYSYLNDVKTINSTKVGITKLIEKVGKNNKLAELHKNTLSYYSNNINKIKNIFSKFNVDMYKKDSKIYIKNYGVAPIKIYIEKLNYQSEIYPYLVFDKKNMFSVASIDSDEIQIPLGSESVDIIIKNLITNSKQTINSNTLGEKSIKSDTKKSASQGIKTSIDSYINNYAYQVKLDKTNYLLGSIMLRNTQNNKYYVIPDYFSKNGKFDLYLDTNNNNIFDTKDLLINYLISGERIYFEISDLIQNGQIFIVGSKNYQSGSLKYELKKSDYKYFEKMNDYENNLKNENMTYELNGIVNKPFSSDIMTVSFYYQGIKYLDINKIGIKLKEGTKQQDLIGKQLTIDFNGNNIIAKFEKIKDNYAYFDFTGDKFIFAPIPLPNDNGAPISPKIFIDMKIVVDQDTKKLIEYDKLSILYDDIKGFKRNLEIKYSINSNNIYSFEKIDLNILTKVGENQYQIRAGKHELKQTIILPKGSNLTIQPGTTILMGEGVSLLSYGTITAVGTFSKPIIFKSLNKKNFGVVGLVQSMASGKFKNVYFVRGGLDYINGIDMSGQLSVYNAKDVQIDSCIFVLGKGDDGLNIKNTPFVVKNSIFFKNSADGFDVDFGFSGSRILNNQFLENGNDGLDLSYSNILIRGNKMIKNADKGISIGEKTKSLILENTILNNNIGIEIKDASKPYIIDNTISENSIGLHTYIKKELFSAPLGYVFGNNIIKNKQQIKNEDGGMIQELSSGEKQSIKNQYLLIK